MKARSLSELQDLKQALAERSAREAREAQARQEAEARARAERELFSRSVGAVKPLADRRVVHWPPAAVPPVALQHQLDEQAVLRESLSDEFDAESLLDTDDSLSFRRPGVGTDVTRKLRRGDWAIQGQVDLHNLRRDEAREALGAYIRESVKSGLRCIRVIHGKGLGSPGKAPVLKPRVHSWLIQKSEVIAFVQAHPNQGGAGALVVLLRPS
jgi:DNA-nicking Smr family endonuclease